MRASRQHLLGFTLIEMLVVIGIIIVVASITIPMIAPFLKHQALHAGARTVQAMLFHARSEAITRRTLAGVYLYQQEHPAQRWPAGALILSYDSDHDGNPDQQLGAPAFLPEGVAFSITVSGAAPTLQAWDASDHLTTVVGTLIEYQFNGFVKPGNVDLIVRVQDKEGAAVTMTIPGYMGR